MADTADLVVLGAWYGTGKKGGMLSIFLMGCYDKARNVWKTVTKVHTGLDDAALEKLQVNVYFIVFFCSFSLMACQLEVVVVMLSPYTMFLYSFPSVLIFNEKREEFEMIWEQTVPSMGTNKQKISRKKFLLLNYCLLAVIVCGHVVISILFKLKFYFYVHCHEVLLNGNNE